MKKIVLTFCVVSLFTFINAFALANNEQNNCPDKRVGEFTVEGTFVKETIHEGYFGFLVKGKDGKNYDIGIGNDSYPPEFSDMKPGATIIIPFYNIQYFDSGLGKCVVKSHLNTESSKKGSYSK